MSVVAVDAVMVAADRLGCCGTLMAETPKLYPARVGKGVKGFAFGFAGIEEAGLIMLDWFDNGAKLSEWPEAVQDSEYAAGCLIVGAKKAWTCGSYPVFTLLRDSIWAIGGGGHIAMGAMAMGASAREAVEIACDLDASCGKGVDFYLRKDLSTQDIKVDRDG